MALNNGSPLRGRGEEIFKDLGRGDQTPNDTMPSPSPLLTAIALEQGTFRGLPFLKVNMETTVFIPRNPDALPSDSEK